MSLPTMARAPSSLVRLTTARWHATLALVLAAAAICIGCDDDSSATGGRASGAGSTMKFNVDPALIGPMHGFEDFNVQLAPPAGWEPLPAEQVAIAAAAAGIGGNPSATQPAGTQAAGAFPAEALAVFASPDQTMWLIISAVDAPDPKAFEGALRGAHNVLNAESFSTSDIDVDQYLVRPPKLVNVKLLLSAPERKDPRRLQLDYVFPEQSYPESGRILESSLGSLRPIGQKGA